MTLEPRTDRSSRALRFLTRLLRLVVASVMWVLLLVATALAVFVHLVAAALSRATSAMLALFLDAEAAGHKDMVGALGELSGRGKKLEAPPAGRQPVPEIMESRWAERKQTAA
jgi:hypothetical protein